MERGIAATVTEAIQKYINPHKPRRDRIPGSTAVSAIVQAGGIPVWAHPLGGEGEKRLSAEEFRQQLDCLLELGIRGMECCYSRYTHSDTEFLMGRAQSHGLLISGGSDYHGTCKKDLPPGMLCAEDIPIPPESLSILKTV